MPDVARAMLVGAVLWLAAGLLLHLLPIVRPALSNDAPPGPALDDFGVFYSAARLVAAGRGDQLYDLDAIYAEEVKLYERPREHVPLLPYFNPPALAAALAPLTLLPVGTAASLFLTVSLLLALTAVLMLLRGSSPWSTGTWLALATMLAFQSVYDAVYHGQLSFLLLFSFAGAYTAFASGRDRLAGALLGFLLIKPNYALVALAILVWKRRRDALIGFAGVAAIGAAVSVLVSGAGIVWTYPRFLRDAATWDDSNGITIAAMFGWNALVRLHVGPGQMALVNLWTAALSLLTLFALLWTWRGPWPSSRETLAPRYSALVIASLLVNAHVYRQDVLLMFVPAVLLLGVARGVGKAALGAFFLGAWLAFMYHFVLLRELGINVSVPLMAATFLIACGVAVRLRVRRDEPAPADTPLPASVPVVERTAGP